MTKRLFRLIFPSVRQRAKEAIDAADDGFICEIKEPTRSLDANAAQWPILAAFSEQLEWPVNGKMTKMTPDEWKDLLTAAFEQETVRLAMGLNGGVVMIGARTSKYSKAKFSDWLTFLHATAVDRGVKVYED